MFLEIGEDNAKIVFKHIQNYDTGIDITFSNFMFFSWASGIKGKDRDIITFENYKFTLESIIYNYELFNYSYYFEKHPEKSKNFIGKIKCNCNKGKDSHKTDFVLMSIRDKENKFINEQIICKHCFKLFKPKDMSFYVNMKFLSYLGSFYSG